MVDLRFGCKIRYNLHACNVCCVYKLCFINVLSIFIFFVCPVVCKAAQFEDPEFRTGKRLQREPCPNFQFVKNFFKYL